MTLVEKIAMELCRWDTARRLFAPWNQQGKTWQDKYRGEARRILKMVREEKHDGK